MKRALIAGLLLIALSGCRHTVEVKAPEEPITINLNVKIEHEIRIKVDRELDDLFEEESDIF
jgi:hypothetical protein